MTGRLRAWWQEVRASLWFVPTLMIVGAMALAVAMIELSGTVDREALKEFPRVFGAGAESSRQMLSTIATAMMTVAGVTFSITVVAVTQASSQYTPRILRNFMRDRPSQLTLGTLTGVFVYCLVVIRTVRGDEELRFIPSVAVLGAFVLAILAIGVLVYFIHHVAGSLQAAGILARVRDETTAAIERLFPDALGEEGSPPLEPAEDDARREWQPVAARRTGYVRGLDAAGLLRFATEHDVVVRMELGIGEHVVRGSPLASVAPARLDADGVRALAALYDVGDFRTVEQDAAFGVRQMVDVAVKALSPGINDTTTAITAIDALGAVLVSLADRRVEERYRYCDGQLRVIARGPSFASLVTTAIDEIRQNAEGNVSVLARLLAMLAVVGEHATHPARSQLLLRHAERILAVAERTVPDPENRREVREAFARVRRVVVESVISGPRPVTRLPGTPTRGVTTCGSGRA